MKPSSFFYNGHYKKVVTSIKNHINSAPPFLSEQTASSTRAVGDAVENLIADTFDSFLGKWCGEYSSSFARRAMADIAFKDKEGYSRKKWMLALCDTMLAFYPKEIVKIQERTGRFQEVKSFWEKKEDIWT